MKPGTLQVAVPMHRDGTRSSIDLHRHLPAALQLNILSLLPPNERSISGRLVSRDAAAGLIGAQHSTASLSQPLPRHAAPWAFEAGQQHVRQLPFMHKLQLLCTAAASGCEVNLEVALALLKPSIFPELLHSFDFAWARTLVSRQANPGEAAVTAGHSQLLGWLLRHCPGLVGRNQVLTAAAEHCDLAGLQAVFGALSVDPAGRRWLLDRTAGSATADAVAKMEWTWVNGEWRWRPLESTAVAAARSGDLGRLRWLRERGCSTGGLDALENALQHADLAVAQWLVDEAGCELPEADTDDDTDGDEDQVLLAGREYADESQREVGWGSLLEAAARSPDGVAKVGWLLQRRGRPSKSSHWQRMAVAAAKQDRVEMVRHALSALGPTGDVPQGLAHAAVGSGSVPMVQFMRHAGVAFDCEAYIKAAQAGSLAMVRWLACDARVAAEGLDLPTVVMWWPQGRTAATSRELLQAVQLLVGEAGWRGWGTTGDAVAMAARRGDLALVQYLLQQRPGYQPDWSVEVAAAGGGCEALLEWLVEQHPGWLAAQPGGTSPYVSAAKAGDLGTLTALRRLGVPWGTGNVVVDVVACGGFATAALHWLVEQGAPVGSYADLQAAINRLAEDVRWGIEDWLRGLVRAQAASGEA